MLAKQKATGAVYAIKVLKKSMVLEKDELDHTLTENSVLAKANHPFLTCLKYSFQTKDLLCFVMEYVNGGEVGISPFFTLVGFIQVFGHRLMLKPNSTDFLSSIQGPSLHRGSCPLLYCRDLAGYQLFARAGYYLPRFETGESHA